MLVNMTFYKYPLKFCTYMQNVPEIEIFYIFFLILIQKIFFWSSDIMFVSFIPQIF